MKIRDFLEAIPRLCYADNAKRYGWINAAQFDEELRDLSGIFARNDDDEQNPRNRIETLFGFSGGDMKRIAYCKDLTELLFRAHYKNEHGEDRHNKRIDELVLNLIDQEAEYPDIAAMMTIEEAVTVKGWNG